MPFTDYQIVVVHPRTGEQLNIVDGRRIQNLRYVRRLNDVGEFSLTVLATDRLAQWQGVRDLLFDIYRINSGNKFSYENTYSLRYVEVFEDENDIEWLIFSGEDLMGLFLKYRVINYLDDPLGANGYSTKFGICDQVMRDYVTEQAISPAVNSARAFPGLTVAPLLNIGQTVAERVSDDKTLLEVLQGLTSQGRVDFTLTHNGSLTFIFQVLSQGRDKRRSTNYPVSDFIYFTPNRGNMKSPRLTVDAKAQYTAIYVKGQGPRGAEASALYTSPEKFDSPFNYREKVAQAQSAEQGSLTINQQLETAGSSELEKNAQKVTFTFQINVTGPQARYNIDWFLGDRVTGGYMNFEQDFRITEVEIQLSASGEIITPTLEGN